MTAALGRQEEVLTPYPPLPRAGEGGRGEDLRSGERSALLAPRAALAVVLVLALGIRLWGLDWQLPWQFHPDEGHYTWKAMELIERDSLNPRYFRNPSLFTYMLLGEFRLLGFASAKAGQGAPAGTGAATEHQFRPPSGAAF